MRKGLRTMIMLQHPGKCVRLPTSSPARRLGWPHLGQHTVEAEAFDPVGAAEAVDLKLAVAAVDFKGEQVLPLAPRRVQPSDPPCGGRQRQKRIVLHLGVPEKSPERPRDVSKFAEEPLRKVDQMRTLIDQLTAARDRALEPPFLFVARSATVAVAPADK